MTQEKEPEQLTLFDMKEWWEDEWQDMPEFVQEDLSPFKTIFVQFANRQDMKEFEKLVNQTITFKTQSVWFPKATIDRYANKRYIEDSEEK